MMPIHVPGKRQRRGKLKVNKRSAVAVLSLTAMVDMFTVLAVFLLQNYATTGQPIHIPKSVSLPQAKQVKELKPANVITLSDGKISLNNQELVLLSEVEGWIVRDLKKALEELISAGEKKKKTFINRTRKAINQIDIDAEKANVDSFRKVTIQADKEIDFLSIKKIMYTATDAGIYEINFAVVKKKEKL